MSISWIFYHIYILLLLILCKILINNFKQLFINLFTVFTSCCFYFLLEWLMPYLIVFALCINHFSQDMRVMILVYFFVIYFCYSDFLQRLHIRYKTNSNLFFLLIIYRQTKPLKCSLTFLKK